MKQAVSLQAAFLLHYTQYQDTSLIIDLFTLEHGRISMMARGARAARSRSRALYQPFRPLLVSWMGDRELRTLTGIEESGAAPDLDNQTLACAYYLNELLLRLVGKDECHTELFAYYSQALAELANPGDIVRQQEITLRRFELQLLEAVGLLPDLAKCTADQQSVEPSMNYLFYPAAALAIPVTAPEFGVRESTPESAVWHADGVTAEESVTLSGNTLLSLASHSVEDESVLDEAKSLMRRLIRLHLGGKPLQSRRLFGSLVQATSKP